MAASQPAAGLGKDAGRVIHSEIFGRDLWAGSFRPFARTPL